jgi:hypothetical protein
VRSDAHSLACDAGMTGSDDSSFVVIFHRACQPPSLRVSLIRFLPSNSLASYSSRDRHFATQYEIRIPTHQIGIFPQSMGNIPHRKILSTSLDSLPAALTTLARMLQRTAP